MHHVEQCIWKPQHFTPTSRQCGFNLESSGFKPESSGFKPELFNFKPEFSNAKPEQCAEKERSIYARLEKLIWKRRFPFREALRAGGED
jgi:hypothetical protein